MKVYVVYLEDELAAFYEEIAQACNKHTKQVLQYTLFKVVAIICKITDKEEDV